MLLKNKYFDSERIESLKLELVSGKTREEVIFLTGWDLIYFTDDLMIFRLNGFFFWKKKYYYFYFKEGKVAKFSYSRFRIKMY